MPVFSAMSDPYLTVTHHYYCYVFPIGRFWWQSWDLRNDKLFVYKIVPLWELIQAPLPLDEMS
jgi:hypothetical protein